MSITLAEAKVGMADKVDQQIVDMFRRSSLLLDQMVFDNVISPGTGGSTLTYGYIQLKSPATASVRAVGGEYTPGEAKKEKKTANAIIMGGAFQMDRVIQNTAGAANEMAFQAEQKIKATANYFHNLVINGSGEVGEEGYVDGTFDGLKKLLAGTANEITSKVSLQTSQELDENYNAFLDEMDGFISMLDGTPSMLLMNRAMLVKLRSIARRAGYYERSQDDFGRTVERYAGVPMVDMGQYFNGNAVEDVVKTDADGKTAIYAVSLGLDGFHGISPAGNGVIQSYLPDLNTPGAVKTGEVELVAGVVLKNTLKAAVLKDIAIVAVAE